MDRSDLFWRKKMEKRRFDQIRSAEYDLLFPALVRTWTDFLWKARNSTLWDASEQAALLQCSRSVQSIHRKDTPPPWKDLFRWMSRLLCFWLAMSHGTNSTYNYFCIYIAIWLYNTKLKLVHIAHIWFTTAVIDPEKQFWSEAGRCATNDHSY